MTPKNDQGHLVKYLNTQFEIIDHLMIKVSHLPVDQEVHGLRIATRRARAVFWCLRHASPHTEFKKLDHSLQRLGKALGRVREIDVAIFDANQFGIDTSRLVLKRKAAERTLKKWLLPKRIKTISNRISAAKRDIKKMDPIGINQAYDHLSTQLCQQLERHIHGETKLHQLRVTLKRAEYALEAEGKSTRPIVRIQTLIGDAHDLQFLRKLTGKNKKVKIRQKLLNQKANHLVKPVLRFTVGQLTGK